MWFSSVLFCLDPGPLSKFTSLSSSVVLTHNKKTKSSPSPVLKMDALCLRFKAMMQLLVMWATADSISRVFVLLAAGGIISAER